MLSSSYQLVRVLGIPVRVHITLILLLPLFAIEFSSRIMPGASLFWGLLAVGGLFSSVALHELGHSVVAIQLGCRVRDIILFPLGGVARLSGLPERPLHEIYIAVAGPLVSIILSAVLIGLSALLASLNWAHLHVLTLTLGVINLVLALFNMLPSFPMDGGRVFRAVLTPKLGRLRATKIAYTVGRVLAVAFGLLGVYYGRIVWIFLAVFIYIAAGAEYRMVRMQADHMRRIFHWNRTTEDSKDEEDNGFTVGPPPYARQQQKRRAGGLFQDLFDRW